MGDRAAKSALFEEFAAVGKALGSPARLELLDLLTQSELSVDDLARAAGLGVSSCSAHLQALRAAGLVRTRRVGKRVYYSLAGEDVTALYDALRSVSQLHRPHTELARRDYLGPEDTDALDIEGLVREVEEGHALLLDVRPREEYDAGHLPGAVHIPLEELGARLDELPRDREIVAYCRGRYCAMAHDAVRLLSAHGLVAQRAEEGVLEWRLAGLQIVVGAA